MLDAKVLVVVVNYKTADYVVNCLASAESDIRNISDARVVVVDNDSGDDSVQTIRAAIDDRGYSEWASVIASDKNGGFASGNNIAIRDALGENPPPDFIMLLNPDAEVRDSGLVRLLQFMQDNPHVGIGGGRVSWPDGTPRASAFRFPSILTEINEALSLGLFSKAFPNTVISRGAPARTTEADWVSGAAMMIRREVIDSAGLMDEKYFLYFEELDYCRQANISGWPCWYVADANFMHIEGQATGVKYDVARPPRRPAYWFASRRHYFIKNHGRLYTVACDLAQIVCLMAWHLKRIILRKPYDKPEHLLRDMIANSAMWRSDS